MVKAISNYLGISREYIYVGNGISQFITSILGLKIFKRIILPKTEFNLYKRTALIHEKETVFIEGIYASEFIKNLKK